MAHKEGKKEGMSCFRNMAFDLATSVEVIWGPFECRMQFLFWFGLGPTLYHFNPGVSAWGCHLSIPW